MNNYDHDEAWELHHDMFHEGLITALECAIHLTLLACLTEDYP